LQRLDGGRTRDRTLDLSRVKNQVRRYGRTSCQNIFSKET
jgi:hypothetical protein